MGTRREVDLIGDLRIDEKHYFGIHTQRAIENFQISQLKVSDFPLFVKSMVLTKKACALANEELGAIPKDKCQMIIDACDKILLKPDSYSKHFPIDIFQGGAGTSVNMNTNEVIANVGLEMYGYKKGEYQILHPNDHVNKSQSTNDAYPTGFRVALNLYTKRVLESLNHLIHGIDKKAAEFADVLKMGRTQLQDAVPMSLGDEFSGWATTLRKEIKNIQYSRDLLLEVNLGATAIGSGVNSPDSFSQRAIHYLAIEGNDHFVRAENLIEATSDCGAYVLLSGSLKRLAIKISKICNDLRLLSSGPRCGIHEINLPEMQAGSSIMPAKVNPVIPEVVNQVCYKVIGNDVTISLAAEAGQLQLNAMEPVIAQCLFESLEFLSNSCMTLVHKCINGITANKEHTYEMVFKSIGIITFLNPYIGHEVGDILGREALSTGKSVRELVLEKGLLPEKKLDEILSPDNLMHPKYSGKIFK